MAGISRRAYAKRRGVSEKAVRNAIAQGRISVGADGKIDPDQADAHWNDGIIPKGSGPGVGGAIRGSKSPVPESAVNAVLETLRAQGAEAPAEPERMTFVQARTANEIMKAQERSLRLDKLRGDLVDRSKASALFFSLARQERDAWLIWPVRVAAIVAAELGADVYAVQNSLDKHVRQHLAEMAELEVRL